METTVVLSSDLYEEFFSCLANLKDSCTDIMIKESIIRQRTDDKNSVFEIDLNDLFGEELTFAISYVKDKFDLFKVFLGKEVTLKVNINEENINDSWYELSDDMSRMKIDFPDMDFLQNEFVSEEELATIVTTTEDDLIFETSIEKTITERIKTITTNFQAHFIKLEFEGEIMSMGAIDAPKTNRVYFLENLPIEMEFDEKHIANMTKTPFMIKHDTAFTFQLFKQPDEMITQNKISTSIGTVPINIYCKSSLFLEDE